MLKLARVFLLFLAALLLPSALHCAEPDALEEKPRPKTAAKAKKKEYDYEKSKYKSYRVLTDPETSVYRYDSKGNPIRPAAKKKEKPKKKKEKPRPPEEDAPPAPEANSAE